MEKILEPLMFKIPSETNIVSITITEDTVKLGAEPEYKYGTREKSLQKTDKTIVTKKN
jgi:ATP-dependent protease Clp ATPase subunit